VATMQLKSMQPATAELQSWDGSHWASLANHVATDAGLFAQLAMPFGAGYLRRPAPEGSIWVIANNLSTSGWIVNEVEFYSNNLCSGSKLTGSAVGSVKSAAASAGGGNLFPQFASDGNTATFWQADCPTTRCPAFSAYVGLDLGQVIPVRCTRFLQSGERGFFQPAVVLMSWDGSGRFEVVEMFEGLGGDTWNTRPK
jgi:hypothetical protein